MPVESMVNCIEYREPLRRGPETVLEAACCLISSKSYYQTEMWVACYFSFAQYISHWS